MPAVSSFPVDNPYLDIPEHWLKQRGETVVFPGLRGKTKKAIVDANKQEIIPKNANIIIQPLTLANPNKAKKFKLTVFEHDSSGANSELPESQRDIIPGKSVEVELKKPHHYLIYNEYFKTKKKQALFADENSPNIHEIEQNRVPDCFLLAAIQAIINHPDGKTFIRSMMRENQDGSVTVRLFDAKTRLPAYFRVPKGVMHDQSGPLNDHKALWIHALENAYAAMSDKGGKTTDASFSSVYSGGGRPEYALKILTGLNTEQTISFSPSIPFWHITQNELDLLSILTSRYSLPEDTKQLLISETLSSKLSEFIAAGSYQGNESEQIKKACEDYEAYFKFYYANKEACDAIINSDNSDANKLFELSNLAVTKGLVEISSFLIHLLNYSFIPTTEENTIRGEPKAFSGVYSEQQQTTFKQLVQAKKEGKFITAGTRQQFAEKVPGLRPKHAYTVLGVETKEDPNLGKSVNYIRLRNPWGQVGRVYQFENNEYKAIEDETAAEFEIELTDFFKYFDFACTSISADKALNFDKQKQELLKSVQITTANLVLSADIKLEELSEFYNHYRYYEKKLVALEMFELEQVSEEIKGIFKVRSQEPQLDDIRELLEDVSVKYYQGDLNVYSEHLYRLLKLDWLQKQEEPNPQAIALARQDIVNHAAYPVCLQIKEKKERADQFLVKFKKQFEQDLEKLFEKLDQPILDVNETNPIKQTVCIFTNLINFALAYQNLLATRAYLNTQEYDEKLDKLLNIIKAVNNIINMQPEFEEKKREFQRLKAEVLSQAANVDQAGQQKITSEYIKELEGIMDTHDPVQIYHIAKKDNSSLATYLYSAFAGLKRLWNWCTHFVAHIPTTLTGLTSKKSSYLKLDQENSHSIQEETPTYSTGSPR